MPHKLNCEFGQVAVIQSFICIFSWTGAVGNLCQFVSLKSHNHKLVTNHKQMRPEAC